MKNKLAIQGWDADRIQALRDTINEIIENLIYEGGTEMDQIGDLATTSRLLRDVIISLGELEK